AAYSIREDATVAFAGYVTYSVAFELVMLHFWSFVTQHFNVLEGKRIFPVIAAGSSVGYILAGLTTTVVAVYATEPLILVWTFGSIVALIISIGLEKTLFRPAFVDDADQLLAEHELERKQRGAVAIFRAAISYLTGSRLVFALVLLALVMQIAGRIGDYLVAVIFVGATHNNLQALTILIGNAWLASYVVQLAVSLFVAPFVLSRLGVKNAIMFLPIFTLIGFTLVAISPILTASLFLFIVRNGLQTGLDDPAQNVLGGALPGQVAPKLKFLLDNLVLPGAAVVTGAGLLIFQGAVETNVAVLAVVGIGAAVLFIVAASRVRGLYVNAIYERLRTHAVTIADFHQAVGRPNPNEVAELQGFIRGGDAKAREFAAAALARASPAAFAAMLPELLAEDDAVVRRLALQLAPPDRITVDELEVAMEDQDGWVRAAVAVAGATRKDPWPRVEEVLATLRDSSVASDRAAATWAAAFLSDHRAIVHAMSDSDSRVRLEAIRSFAKMKGQVDGVAPSLIACLGDENVEVRREALRQAIRWAPPPDLQQQFAEALAGALSSRDRDVRRLAAEAMASQSPEALGLTLPLLLARDETSAAAIEALMRSGNPQLFRHARGYLETQLVNGRQMARMSARVATAMRYVDGDLAVGYSLLRIGLDDYVRNASDAGLAAMRALHGKRGFATIERGLVSSEPRARVEALETLINFGPGWLAGPLARLLEPESFDPMVARPLSQAELEALAAHSDQWVRQTAEAAVHGLNEQMKELIALKQVPLFSTLTLDQLSAIDRLMVTRHYVKGESIFRKGDTGSELYVVIEGEVRVHLDGAGRELTLARHGVGSVVGEMSVFDEQPRSAGAQAMTDTTVRVLRRDRLHAVVNEHPEVLLEFVKNLSHRLREMDEKIASAQHASEVSVEAANALLE
ncbi:MAG TPA: cyclic nucleotide-binding domain-containing protein, partial [Candidatus Udaeobacter sp.]|nr:cyclic nucleotide-binding domain-containing protein [Candidatus Udaeobacter sp.]